jgi:hypothetical protein
MALARDLLILLASDTNVAALERLYFRVIERVLRELAAGVSRAGAARARETLIRIRQLAAALDPRRDSLVRDWIRRELPKAFILGDIAAARELERQLADAGADSAEGIKVNRAFGAVNQTQLGILVATMIAKLEDAHRQILQTAGMVIRNTQLRAQTNAEVRAHVVDGIVRGLTGREVSNAIAKAILTGRISPEDAARLRAAGHAGDLELYRQLSEGKLITVGGRRFDVRAYANLVARTMSREAASVATVLRLQQSGVGHIQVSETMPLEPDVCSLVAGNVYYIGEGADPLGFPAYASMPGGKLGLHPHCRHVPLPFVAVRKPEPFIDELRANVFASRDFFGTSSSEASRRVHELVKSGGIAALHKYNPRLFGLTPGGAKGKAA